jgi:predicted transcriptional regulator
MKRPSVETIKNTISQAMGNLTIVAKSLGVSRTAVFNWVQEYELKGIVEEARENRLDFVESALDNLIKKGDTAAIIFFLKTQGRSRGYSEKVDVEHTGKDGGAIQFDVKQMTTDELRKIISSARDSITRISSQTDD